MTISDTIRVALVKGGISQSELTRRWNYVSRQAMYNKFARGSWSANELANIAELTGGQLLIRYPDGQEIPVPPETNVAEERKDGE